MYWLVSHSPARLIRCGRTTNSNALYLIKTMHIYICTVLTLLMTSLTVGFIFTHFCLRSVKHFNLRIYVCSNVSSLIIISNLSSLQRGSDQMGQQWPDGSMLGLSVPGCVHRQLAVCISASTSLLCVGTRLCVSTRLLCVGTRLCVSTRLCWHQAVCRHQAVMCWHQAVCQHQAVLAPGRVLALDSTPTTPSFTWRCVLTTQLPDCPFLLPALLTSNSGSCRTDSNWIQINPRHSSWEQPTSYGQHPLCRRWRSLALICL